MAVPLDANAERRVPLSKGKVLKTAIDLADRGGIGSLSMRKLSQELGAGTMSLYNHVANEQDLLDGMIDTLFSEIDLPLAALGWKAAMRQRALSKRSVMTGIPGPSDRWSGEHAAQGTLRHHDAVIGCLLDAGFSLQLTAHAFSALDS
jgi:AcrR family transcriptional regulator